MTDYKIVSKLKKEAFFTDNVDHKSVSVVVTVLLVSPVKLGYDVQVKDTHFTCKENINSNALTKLHIQSNSVITNSVITNSVITNSVVNEHSVISDL
jgi:hypothetical protein